MNESKVLDRQEKKVRRARDWSIITIIVSVVQWLNFLPMLVTTLFEDPDPHSHGDYGGPKPAGWIWSWLIFVMCIVVAVVLVINIVFHIIGRDKKVHIDFIISLVLSISSILYPIIHVLSVIHVLLA